MKPTITLDVVIGALERFEVYTPETWEPVLSELQQYSEESLRATIAMHLTSHEWVGHDRQALKLQLLTLAMLFNFEVGSQILGHFINRTTFMDIAEWTVLRHFGLHASSAHMLIPNLHSSNAEVRRWACHALGYCSDPTLLPFVVPLLQDDDEEVFGEAIAAAVGVDPDLGLPYVLPFLRDSRPYIRDLTCGVIHDRGDARALLDIVQLLRYDPDDGVRLIAAHTLGRIGDLDTIATLLWVTLHDTGADWEGRPVALGALEAILEILMNVFGDTLTSEPYLPLTQHTSMFHFVGQPLEGAFAHTRSQPKTRLQTTTIYQPRTDLRQRC